MTKNNHTRRVVQINANLTGCPEPQLRSVKPKKITDYPEVPAAYRPWPNVTPAPCW